MEPKEESTTSSSFICDVCGKAIANKCNLKRHKLMHTGFNESVKCEICQKTLSSEGNLKRHMRMHIGVQERQECSACGKSFSNVGNLRRHLRTHQAPGVHYECKLCKKCFPFEDYLKKHVRTVHGCNEMKRKPESTLPHIESFIKREDEHNDETSEQASSQPQAVARSAENEKDIVCSNSNTTERLQPCEPESPLHTVVKTELKESPIDNNPTQEADNSASSNSVSTEKTQEIEGPGAELREKLCPTDQCNICRQVLTDPAQVKLNVWRMHLDMRMVKKEPSERFSFEYNCTVCGKFLSNKGNLKRHMLLLHKKDLNGSDVDANIEQMRSECHICGRMVANKGNLKRHMEKVHVVKRITTETEGSGTDENRTTTPSAAQIYPSTLPGAIKSEATESTTDEKHETPVKKRRMAKENLTSSPCVSDECPDQKSSLKVRIKNTSTNASAVPMESKDAMCMEQPTICNDPTCPEYKKQAQEAQEQAQASMMVQPPVASPVKESSDTKEQDVSAGADNSSDLKGSNRWRSRSFDDVYALQPNASVKNGLCQSQWGEMYSCPMCKRRFLCEDNFKKHMKRHRSCKLPKPVDTQMTLEGINEVAPNTLMCHLCGQVMPFPASLQHHLQVVHGTAPTAPPVFPTTTACYPKPPNEFVNWSYPPILTRFAKRDSGTEGSCESVFSGHSGSVGIPNVMTSLARDPPQISTMTFSAPTTPLRKYVESQPATSCATPERDSPASVGRSVECGSPIQKDDPPVLVIMQPRCA